MKNSRKMSPYDMMKTLILSGDFDRADFEYKISRYLAGKRITQIEADELIALMDASELVNNQ